jgi:hypothetical protein
MRCSFDVVACAMWECWSGLDSAYHGTTNECEFPAMSRSISEGARGRGRERVMKMGAL